jgi:hypothetical protein
MAMKTIEAISTFTMLFPSSHPSAYFCTASLVQCIYQLIPFLRESAKSKGDKAVFRSFREARELLTALSGLTHGAKSALSAVKSVDIEDEDEVPLNTVELRARSCAMVQNELQSRNQAYDSTYMTLSDSPDFSGLDSRIVGLDMWSPFSLGRDAMPREVLSRSHNIPPQLAISNFDFSSDMDFDFGQAGYFEELCYPSSYEYSFVADTS